MSPSVLIVGPGDLGGAILELLAREPGVARILAAGRNAERGVARCNLARAGAAALGLAPRIEFRQLDLADVDATAGLLEREAPDIVLTTATALTWWLPRLLPAALAERLDRAGFGPWLPVHLAPTLKLMRAVREAGYAGHVLIAPFPDAVCPVLARLGLGATAGIGNLAEIVAKVRALAVERTGAPPESLRVTLVAHHALVRWAFSGSFGSADGEPPPFHLRIERDGEPLDEGWARELLLAPWPLPTGRATHALTAATVVPLIRALTSEEEHRLHLPGVEGLPGGYPARVDRSGARVAPVPGLTRAQAIAINEGAQRFDGIDAIEPDGTVSFEQRAAAVLRDELGYDCPRLAPGAIEDRAEELRARFGEHARRHGVDLERWRNV